MPRVPRYAWCDSLRISIVRLVEEKQDSLLKHSRTGRVRSSEVVSRPPALAQVLCSTLAAGARWSVRQPLCLLEHGDGLFHREQDRRLG